MFACKAAAVLIKPETLPPTEEASSCTAFTAFIPSTRDWMLLQSIPLNPEEYGWIIGNYGYEPVPTLDPI